MHIQALILCSGAEDHIAEGKAIMKAGAQIILRFPLLFAHRHFKAEVFGSRPRALRASSPGRERLGRAEQEELAWGKTAQCDGGRAEHADVDGAGGSQRLSQLRAGKARDLLTHKAK